MKKGKAVLADLSQITLGSTGPLLRLGDQCYGVTSGNQPGDSPEKFSPRQPLARNPFVLAQILFWFSIGFGFSSALLSGRFVVFLTMPNRGRGGRGGRGAPGRRGGRGAPSSVPPNMPPPAVPVNTPYIPQKAAPVYAPPGYPPQQMYAPPDYWQPAPNPPAATPQGLSSYQDQIDSLRQEMGSRCKAWRRRWTA